MRNLKNKFNNRYKNKKEKQVFLAKFCFISVLIFSLIFLFDNKIKPTIREVGAYQAKVYATKVINTAVYNELVHTEYTYANFVNLSMDKQGNITALETDVMSINRIKTRIMNQLIQDFDALSKEKFSIPLGSLTGSTILSGKGFNIPFKLIYTGNMDISFEDHFENIGINQTKHQIILKINIEMSAVLPGNTFTISVPSNYYLADTIIVGSVPDSYTNIYGDQQDMIGRINDYSNK